MTIPLPWRFLGAMIGVHLGIAAFVHGFNQPAVGHHLCRDPLVHHTVETNNAHADGTHTGH